MEWLESLKFSYSTSSSSSSSTSFSSSFSSNIESCSCHRQNEISSSIFAPATLSTLSRVGLEIFSVDLTAAFLDFLLGNPYPLILLLFLYFIFSTLSSFSTFSFSPSYSFFSLRCIYKPTSSSVSRMVRTLIEWNVFRNANDGWLFWIWNVRFIIALLFAKVNVVVSLKGVRGFERSRRLGKVTTSECIA